MEVQKVNKELLVKKWLILFRQNCWDINGFWLNATVLIAFIKEKTLITAGVIEEKNFIEIGTIMGADYAITGTTYYGKKALVVAKVIDISTGTVVGMAQVYIDFRDYE